MRAAALDRFGGPQVLTIHKGKEEVLIALENAGVGLWDPDMRSGRYPEITRHFRSFLARTARAKSLLWDHAYTDSNLEKQCPPARSGSVPALSRRISVSQARGWRTPWAIRSVTGMSPRNLDPARHARAADVFVAAADLPPQEQRAFLGRECADDRELLEMVEQLLAEDRKGSILPEPKPAASPSRESLSGLTLSHYRILEPAGEGGMGKVYRAIDTRLDRIVALKFQPPQILRNTASRDRFWREAKTIASIGHPNVCPVYEMEEDGAFLFIAMAYLEGISLDRRIASGRVSIDEALKIAIQAGRGLEAAHSKGIVHRDIKPANLMLTPTASGAYLVRILDFGIAQSLRESAGAQNELTMGTVCYMAPEQIRTGRVDASADIWVARRCSLRDASGRLPFERGSVHETLQAIRGPTLADFSVCGPKFRPAWSPP